VATTIDDNYIFNPTQGKQDMGQVNNEAQGLNTSWAMDIKKEFYFEGIQLCSV